MISVDWVVIRHLQHGSPYSQLYTCYIPATCRKRPNWLLNDSATPTVHIDDLLRQFSLVNSHWSQTSQGMINCTTDTDPWMFTATRCPWGMDLVPGGCRWLLICSNSSWIFNQQQLDCSWDWQGTCFWRPTQMMDSSIEEPCSGSSAWKLRLTVRNQ